MPIETVDGTVFFDFANLAVVADAPTVELPPLPEKVTQEELKFMRHIAGAVDEWKGLRGDPKPYRYLSDGDRRKMEQAYAQIKQAETIAALFVPRKRLKELMDYATKHAGAVIYTCLQKGIR